MSSHDIICPTCLAPATKWFEFGGRADPHTYYHCETCGRSCAVQQPREGRPGRRSAWVRELASGRPLVRSLVHQG